MTLNRALTSTLVFALVGGLLTPGLAEAQCRGRWRGQHPYGDYCRGPGWYRYGAKDPVKSEADARRRLKEFYAERDVTVGTVKERDLHYEADILDANGKVVDRVIIDRRSGRIRSIL